MATGVIDRPIDRKETNRMRCIDLYKRKGQRRRRTYNDRGYRSIEVFSGPFKIINSESDRKT